MRAELLFLAFLNLTVLMEGNCQSDNYNIHALGINNVKLNVPKTTIRELQPLTGESFKDYIFGREERAFDRIDIIQERSIDIPFIYKNIFIASDSMGIVQKIILFLEGDILQIIEYFDKQLECKHIIFESFKDNSYRSQGYIWNTNVGSTITLSDFSQLYRTNVIMVQFYSNTESISKYTVIKNFIY